MNLRGKIYPAPHVAWINIPLDQERALSTTVKVLSDEAQNIIAVYESALFAKSSPHVECRTESKFNIC